MEFQLNNGVNIPSVGLGTFQLKSPEVESVVEAAIKEGYHLIDTAAVYHNEKHIGKVLNKLFAEGLKREDIFITTKLEPAAQGKEKAEAAALNSIKSLSLDYVDLYLIHWPGASGMKSDDEKNPTLRKETWLELEKLYLQGKFRALGVSNYTKAHLEELLTYCSVRPSVLQVEVHPFLTQEELRNFCCENQIHVQAYSSLGSHSGKSEILNSPAVIEISKEVGKSPAQVLLRWAVQQGMSVIPRTSKLARLKENRDIFDFTLNDYQLKILNQMNTGRHYCWNPELVK